MQGTSFHIFKDYFYIFSWTICSCLLLAFLHFFVHQGLLTWGLTGEHREKAGVSLTLNWKKKKKAFLFLLTFNWTFSSVQSLSRVRLFATPWAAARQASLFITSSRSSPKPMSIKLVMPSNHFILCHPLLLLPSIFPSIKVFSKESALCIKWPKYWSFSFNISPANEYSGLISFRMDWLDLFADSWKSSPTPQFKSISFSELSFLYSPTLTSIHDYWKKHSFD